MCDHIDEESGRYVGCVVNFVDLEGEVADQSPAAVVGAGDDLAFEESYF